MALTDSPFGSRNRCASGGDTRRIADILRGDSEVCGHGTYGSSASTKPFSAWESGDRGSAPGVLDSWYSKSPLAQSPLKSARASQQQIDDLAERVGSVVVGVQRQCDTDRRASDRRFQQLERQLQGALGRLEGDYARDSDWREKFSLLQGSITGLVDETQAVSRRVDGLDERLWTRTNGAEEIARQATRDFSTQLQAIERQTRLAAASAEEAQKRQATRQRRADTMLEEFAWRIQKAEERAGMPGLDGYGQVQDLRMQELGSEVHSVSCRLQNLEAQLAGIAAADDLDFGGGAVEGEDDIALGDLGTSPHSLQAVERDFRAMERRVNAQLEELSTSMASMRVKLDGQSQRHASLLERLETAHVPALEALRNELMEARARDMCEMQARMVEQEDKSTSGLEAMEYENIADKMEKLLQRVSGSEAAVASLRRDFKDLRGNMSRPSPANGRDVADELQPTLQDQLAAVADQLEAMDDLSDRVAIIFDRVCVLEARQSPPLPRLESMTTEAKELPSRARENRPQNDASAKVAPRKLEPVISSVAKSSDFKGLSTKGDALDDILVPRSGVTEKQPSMQDVHGLAKTNSPLSPGRSGGLVGRISTIREARPAPLKMSSGSESEVHPAPASSSGAAPAPETSLPVSSAPSRQLSRKQSLDSSLSCDVADAQDECVDDSDKDALVGKCDVTLEVMSPWPTPTAQQASSSVRPLVSGGSDRISPSSRISPQGGLSSGALGPISNRPSAQQVLADMGLGADEVSDGSIDEYEDDALSHESFDDDARSSNGWD